MTSAVPARPVPGVVTAFAAGADVEPVWLNQLGGVTYRIADGEIGRFVKWQPRNPATSLRRDEQRLRWARQFITVPEVVASGSDGEAEWLVTVGLSGHSAVAPRWRADPARAVAAVGAGLRMLHESVPVDQCPWRWAPEDRVAAARTRGLDVPGDLDDAPAVDEYVVCHGDACCPNTLLLDDGTVSGHVDVGSMGIGDRWADVAVAAMSTRWNYGPGWEELLISAYGVEPDARRLDYYRRLWNAT